jgi:hypothetical protein
MYEQPSLHLELARLRHKDFQHEAQQARLAAQVERTPSEGLAVVKSAVSGLRNVLARRRPAVIREPRLQPTG